MFKRIYFTICFLLMLCWLGISLTACQFNQESDFPVVPQTNVTTKRLPDTTADPAGTEFANPDDGTDQSAESLDEPSKSDQPSLRVAGPWSAVDLQLLVNYRALIAAEVSTLEAGQLNGDRINLDWLSGYESDLHVIHVPLSADGPSSNLAAVWTASSNWPDLVLTQTAFPTTGQPSPFIDLTSYLADDPRFSADKIFSSLLTISQGQDQWTGIPYLVNIPVLYYNRTILKPHELADLSTELSWNEFSDLIESVNRRLALSGRLLNPVDHEDESMEPSELPVEQRPVLVAAGLEAMLDYWPASQNAQLGWSTWDGKQFNFKDPSFLEGILAVRTFRKNHPFWMESSHSLQGSMSYTPLEQLIRNNQVAFWVGDSADAKRYTEIDLVQSGMSQDSLAPSWTFLPLRQTDQPGRYPVRLTTLSIARNSLNPAEATDLAAFLATDSDALVLQARLGIQDGRFPIVRDKEVWDAWLMLQAATVPAGGLSGRLNHVYAEGLFDSSTWQSFIQKTYSDAVLPLLTESDPQRVIRQLDDGTQRMDE